MTKIRIPHYVSATIMVIAGILLDHNTAIASQALHHAAFILAGIFIGLGVNR